MGPVQPKVSYLFSLLFFFFFFLFVLAHAEGCSCLEGLLDLACLVNASACRRLSPKPGQGHRVLLGGTQGEVLHMHPHPPCPCSSYCLAEKRPCRTPLMALICLRTADAGARTELPCVMSSACIRSRPLCCNIRIPCLAFTPMAPADKVLLQEPVTDSTNPRWTGPG